MVGFNYRRVPAVALARQLVAEGRLGEIRHVRAQYLQDWIVDPAFPLVWRLQQGRAGSGALGDIGAHIVDLAQFVTGQLITGVAALTETFVKERPLPAASARAVRVGRRPGRGAVTVDDAALFLGPLRRRRARRRSRPPGSPPAARTRCGSRSTGRAAASPSTSRSMNELQFYDGTEDPAATPGFRRILVTEPTHPYVGAWWPPGHGLGYEHSFTHEVVDLVTRSRAGARPEAVVRRRAAGQRCCAARRRTDARADDRRAARRVTARRPADAPEEDQT